jgi:sulfatase modifying factor 1
VEYAHGEGVLHRDLKPANLLLTEEGSLLADFGLARALDASLMRSRLEHSILNSMHVPVRTVTEEDLLRTNPDTKPSEALALMGTLAYMAPELKPPKYEEHSEQSDLYALGLIVWQMLTGESEPGIGESASDLREDLTERWDTWLSRALARKRERRFASVREMREAWGALVGEPGVKMEGSYAGEARVFGGITMVWCPSGKFLLGSPEEEEGRYISEKQHEVTMEKGFWLAKTECTQGQWESVMGTDVCGQSKKGKVYGTVTGVGRDHPMYFVSWDDAQEWVAKMNDEQPPGECWEWVLPTDAQWEYACRAGSAGAYGGTGNLDEMGWYAENSGNTVHEVGGKRPNDWGFHDMHGNVWEWCANWYREYLVGAVIDPDSDNRVFCRPGRVFRGGCWRVNGRRCRSADRGLFDPGISYSSLGFRPAICSSR